MEVPGLMGTVSARNAAKLSPPPNSTSTGLVRAGLTASAKRVVYLCHKNTINKTRTKNVCSTLQKPELRQKDAELSDIQIPELCPVFKTPMVSPSLDRIDSSKGYVKGNVRVISKRANQLKSNATVEEMEMVLADLIHLRKSVCEIL